MNSTNNMKSGFKLLKIMLIESHFERQPIVTFDNPDIKDNTNVSVNVDIEDNIVNVFERIDYQQVFEDQVEIECSITMFGQFAKIGEDEIDMKMFGKINGAAIVFPYIREHLSNLSAKAGLGLILLPPINFTNPPNV